MTSRSRTVHACRPRRRAARSSAARAGTSLVPPRTSATGRGASESSARRRNTPTYVGKTSTRPGSDAPGQKHPHVRGEDATQASTGTRSAETPPRTWGRLTCGNKFQIESRNTPTYVGKTLGDDNNFAEVKKHPHVRGEDAGLPPLRCYAGETPPRTWGRHAVGRQATALPENTPTYVGKTRPAPGPCGTTRKHPHVRGEDDRFLAVISCFRETPPRTWGRLEPKTEEKEVMGNTPTYVGKTSRS